MFWASEITASDLKRGKNFVRVFATRTLPIIAAYCMYTTILTNALGSQSLIQQAQLTEFVSLIVCKSYVVNVNP